MLSQRVRVHLVGVGGNGAQMANCLARLDIAMRALGHPYGLHVTAFDGDQVSESNVGRQIYSPADVGLHKAVVTINRLNQYFGLDWDAVPRHYDTSLVSDQGSCPSIVISCVDSARARRDLHRRLFQRGARATYWLDLGNTWEAVGAYNATSPTLRRAYAERVYRQVTASRAPPRPGPPSAPSLRPLLTASAQ